MHTRDDDASSSKNTPVKKGKLIHPRTACKTSESFGYRKSEWDASTLVNARTSGMLICDLKTGKLTEYRSERIESKTLEFYLAEHPDSIVLMNGYVSAQFKKSKEWIARGKCPKTKDSHQSYVGFLESGSLTPAEVDMIEKKFKERMGILPASTFTPTLFIDPLTGEKKAGPIANGFSDYLWRTQKLRSKKSGGFIYLDIAQTGKLFECEIPEGQYDLSFINFLKKNPTCILVMDRYVSDAVMQKYGFVTAEYYRENVLTLQEKVKETPYVLNPDEWNCLVRYVKNKIPTLAIESLPEPSKPNAPTQSAHFSFQSVQRNQNAARIAARPPFDTKSGYGFCNGPFIYTYQPNPLYAFLPMQPAVFVSSTLSAPIQFNGVLPSSNSGQNNAVSSIASTPTQPEPSTKTKDAGMDKGQFIHPRTGSRINESFGYRREEWRDNKLVNCETGGVLICDLKTGKLTEYRFLEKCKNETLAAYLAKHSDSIVLMNYYVSARFKKSKGWSICSKCRSVTKNSNQSDSDLDFVENGSLTQAEVAQIEKKFKEKMHILPAPFFVPSSHLFVDPLTGEKKENSISHEFSEEQWRTLKLRSKTSGGFIFLDKTQPGKLFEYEIAENPSGSDFVDFLKKNASFIIVMSEYLSAIMKQKYGFVTREYYITNALIPEKKVKETPYMLTPAEWNHLVRCIKHRIPDLVIESFPEPPPTPSPENQNAARIAACIPIDTGNGYGLGGGLFSYTYQSNPLYAFLPMQPAVSASSILSTPTPLYSVLPSSNSEQNDALSSTASTPTDPSGYRVNNFFLAAQNQKDGGRKRKAEEMGTIEVSAEKRSKKK